MLTITVPSTELYDEDKNEFIQTKEKKLVLEHSLVSISKWEAIWNKPFLSDDSKTNEQVLDYIKCMTITQNIKDEVYLQLSNNNIESINEYIDSPMTATTITNEGKPNREVITSEIIYYWMIAHNIPLECQKWHLNKLLTLINVCNIKSQPKKKMSRSEILRRNRDLNSKRKKALNTKG